MSDYPVPEISGDEYISQLKKMIKLGKDMNKNQKNLEGYSNQQYSTIEGFESQDLNIYNSSLDVSNSDNNTLSSKYNIEREILMRKEELQELENQNINQQYIRMQNLQSQIFTKERLIEENLYHAEQNENNMRTLMGTFLFAIVLFLIISMYGSGKLEDTKLYKLCIILLFLFILFIMFQYNIFYLNQSLKYLFSFQFLSSVGKEIEQKTAEMKEDINKAKYGTNYDTWKNKNCGVCPPPSQPSEISAGDFVIETSGYAPSFYYQDGSTPNQVIVPTNTRSTSGTYIDQIHHTDVNMINKKGFPDIGLIGPNDGQLVGTNTYTRSL